MFICPQCGNSNAKEHQNYILCHYNIYKCKHTAPLIPVILLILLQFHLWAYSEGEDWGLWADAVESM